MTTGRLALVGLLLASCVPVGDSPTAATDHPAAPPFDIPDSAETLLVERVLDGDSLFASGDSGDVEIRLFGINTPEGGECLGDEARRALVDAAGSSIVVAGLDTDQFGRTVALVWSADGHSINVDLVRRGLAVTVTGALDDPPPQVIDLLIAAQDHAADSAMGLWADNACGSTEPRPLVYVEMSSPNPVGPDDEHLDEEYVTITNVGPVEVDVSGWTIRDESTANRLIIPDGTVMMAGESLRVISGCSRLPDSVAWCANRSIWSNGGDSVFLLDRTGRIISTDRYRP